MKTWTNWMGNQSCSPVRIVAPVSERGVQRAVRDAAAAGHRVRAAASGHSFNDSCLTSGTLLLMSGLRGITDIDSTRKTVTVRPGTLIADLGDPLWDRGLSIRNQGDIDAQQLAGAISTATHGSGYHLQNVSASVNGLRLVTSDGEMLVADEHHPELLAAARVSLGMLGVITEITLAVREAYTLHERVEHWNLTELRDGWPKLFQSAHHVSLHYYPTAQAHALFDFPAPEATNARGLTRVTRCEAVASPDEVVERAADRTGRPHHIYPQHCEPNFHEMEYMVDFRAGFDPVQELLGVLERFPNQAIYPVEIRVTASDDSMLSPDCGRRSLVLSVSGEPGTDYWPFFRAVHEALVPYDARPHWGKIHLFSRQELARALPRYGEFVATRQQLDPSGTFLNPSLERLFS